MAFLHIGPEYVQYVTGSCREFSDFVIYVCRALGIPCAINEAVNMHRGNNGYVWASFWNKNNEEYIISNYPPVLVPIAELFSKQYKFLDKMCSVLYFETHGCGKDKDAIFKQVKIEIERFSTDKRFLRELEGILNLHLDGVMKTLRSELPHLSEMDFRLLCFLLAGFSAKAISVFTGDSTGNIYVRKYRLKNEIQAIDPQISTKILEYFM